MADEGIDLGYCEECGAEGIVVYVTNEKNKDVYADIPYCRLHVPKAPLKMDDEAVDMAFEKAGVPHQKRFRPLESILGLLWPHLFWFGAVISYGFKTD